MPQDTKDKAKPKDLEKELESARAQHEWYKSMVYSLLKQEAAKWKESGNRQAVTALESVAQRLKDECP